MKTTKYLSHVSFGLIMAGMLAGCSDSFLEQDPLSFYEPATTYNSESGIKAAIAVCDRHLRYMYTSGNTNNAPIASDYFFSEIGLYGKTDANATDMQDNFAEKITPTSGLLDNGDGNHILTLWNESFNGVKYANTVLSYVDGVEGLDEKTKNMYKGMAYFHRAIKYYNLVFWFGDLPLISRIIDVPKQNYKTTKKEAILEMLVHDLEFAVENVPTQNEIEYYGMVNQEACMHLLIKCYLATGRYKQAEDMATDLINNHGLALMTEPFGTDNPGGCSTTWPITRNVIWDLHRAENKIGSFNKECILGIPNMSSQALVVYAAMRIFGPFWNNGGMVDPSGKQAGLRPARNASTYDATESWVEVLGRGIATMRMSDYAQNGLWVVNGEMDRQDLRHNSEVGNWVNMTDLRYNNPDSPEWYGKNYMLYNPENGNLLCPDTIRSWFDHPLYKIFYNDAVADASMSSNDWEGARAGSNGNLYQFRLAETYLLRAEAKLYQGHPAEAAEDVNIIRRRANAKQMYTTVNIGDIADERARELFLEEFRKVELVRISMCLAQSGIPDEWGNTYGSNWDKQSGTDATGGSYWYQRCIKHNIYNRGYTISSGNATALNYTMDKRNVFWPIPNSAITANNKAELAQNYGYDGYNPSVAMWDNWQDAVADESVTE
ncbi:MAG: RagB/SusD family nutrient uptake outer membrane protein [Bacteroidales bacterium]|nr:RagB/SusD family nutrient uptake outer membrane protein [Bacteroidales bacterium]